MNEYIPILFSMATTIHLPGKLLQAVDDRAKELGLSRNRYIVRALERALEEETTWSHAFLTMLEDAKDDEQSQHVIDEMMQAISDSRTRKRAPKL